MPRPRSPSAVFVHDRGPECAVLVGLVQAEPIMEPDMRAHMAMMRNTVALARHRLCPRIERMLRATGLADAIGHRRRSQNRCGEQCGGEHLQHGLLPSSDLEVTGRMAGLVDQCSQSSAAALNPS